MQIHINGSIGNNVNVYHLIGGKTVADEENKDTVSRRKFLKNSGLVAGGVVGGSVLGGLLTNSVTSPDDTKTKSDTDRDALQRARVFFSRKGDFEVLAEATERIFPEDDLGPGAIELGVPYFIDRQLAGAWGTNAKEYMHDPFYQNEQTAEYQRKDSRQDKSGPNTSTKAPTPTPRYQSRLNRGEMFLHGVRTIEKESKDRYDERFINLEEDKQIELLELFEAGEIEMTGLLSNTFFNFLLQMTIEGAYADPVYGGNKDMMGWKMKEYPGPRMAYIDEIEEEKFIVKEPKSLREYQK